jgi:glycosyltransferase involved in cell wall biosynthesis
VNPSADPKLSVIIASHDRRGLLRRCLGSLIDQAADPRAFEVVVADDDCELRTEQMIASLPAPFALRCLPLAKVGKSAAMNAGVEAARGATCLFVDDDIVAAPQLVAAHLAAGSGSGDVLGLGRIEERPPAARDWFAHAFARGAAEHYAELESREARWSDCYGANFSAPREALRRIGGFRVGMAVGEDFDVALRLCQAGCRPVYLPDALGTHDDQKRSSQMIEDAQRQGAAHVELASRCPEERTELLRWEAGATRRELAMRRLCLSLRVPPRLLVWLGRFLPGEGRRMHLLHFTRRLAFWGGVKEASAPTAWSTVMVAPSRATRALGAPLALVPELVEAMPL